MKISDFLNTEKTIVLDGAMGTELQRRGYRTELPLWSAKANLDNPGLVLEIHKSFINAGADIITTNTFRTTRRTFKKIQQPEQAIVATKEAVRIAKEAITQSQSRAYIAASVTTLEDCYEPEMVPSLSQLKEEHFFQIKLLASLEVDLIIAETINSIKEAEVICEAASQFNAPFIISFVTNGKGCLLSAESIVRAINVVKEYNPLGIMLNCRALGVLDSDFTILDKNYDGHKGVYANGCGKPDDNLGWNFEGCINPLEEYLKYAKKWVEKGAKIIGGCCGTTSEYISSIHSLIKNKN